MGWRTPTEGGAVVTADMPAPFTEAARRLVECLRPDTTMAAILIIVESFAALAKVLTAVSMDWADTPDCRDRLTRNDVQQLVNDALDGICRDARRWLSEGLPSDDEVKQRTASAGAGVSAALDAHESKNAELDAQDAEAAADQYGAILLHRDPSVSDAPTLREGVFVHRRGKH